MMGLLSLGVRTATADVYDRLARALTKPLKGAAPEKAAVLPFAYMDGRTSAGGGVVAESLATAVASRSELQLVERSLLSRALDEIKFGSTGAVSPESAQRAGRMLGAKYLLVGTLADAGRSRVDVHARVLETETGVVIAAAKQRVSKTWADVAAPLGEAAVQPLTVKLIAVPPSDAGAAVVRQVGARRLAFLYSNSDGSPALRVTDVTRAEASEAIEVPLPYDPGPHRFGKFNRTFRLNGVRYRAWSEEWASNGPVIHLAPRRGFFGGRIEEEAETVLDFMGLIDRWVKDISRNGHFLPERSGVKLVAYFERQPARALRISLWKLDGPDNEIGRSPEARVTLSGKRGAEAASRVLAVSGRHLRFHYDADRDTVGVEEVLGL